MKGNCIRIIREALDYANSQNTKMCSSSHAIESDIEVLTDELELQLEKNKIY